MDIEKYRSWFYNRQGLGRRRFQTAREALANAGWARSVGGVSPYLMIRARSGEGRAQVDALAADLELFELPSARGCTYVLPKEHFALGLAIGRNFGSATEIATARKLGVTDAEVDTLKEAIVEALANGPLAPAEMKPVLGDKVRNLGEEGKKKGLQTTLPLALGLLQTAGRIRRKPNNGRLDTQRYSYERWDPPLGELPADEDAATEIARIYFGWAGAATVKEFRDFSVFNAAASKAACERAGLVAFEAGTDLFCIPGAREEYDAFDPPSKPEYALVGNLDPYVHVRRGAMYWLDDEDRSRSAPGETSARSAGELAELWSHPILDRGRLIGFWEFDAENGETVWATWRKADDNLRAEVERLDEYIKEDLQDARSFSLDSPVSRRPRLDIIRSIAGS